MTALALPMEDVMDSIEAALERVIEAAREVEFRATRYDRESYFEEAERGLERERATFLALLRSRLGAE